MYVSALNALTTWVILLINLIIADITIPLGIRRIQITFVENRNTSSPVRGRNFSRGDFETEIDRRIIRSRKIVFRSLNNR